MLGTFNFDPSDFFIKPDSTELITNLRGQINLTRVVEVKPNSALLIVCKTDKILSKPEYDFLVNKLTSKMRNLLKTKKVEVVISHKDINFDLDFYRVDLESEN